MQTTKRMRGITVIMAAGMLVAPAAADEIFSTGTPTGGFLGYYGFDVFQDQSVAVAFTAGADYTLDSVGLWMMSNDFDNAGAPYTVSLQTSMPSNTSPDLAPSGVVLETWDVQTAAIGWTPILETQTSTLHPLLQTGETYWIVLESDSPAFVDAVWVASGQNFPVLHGIINSANPTSDWYTGYTQGAPGMVINGTLVPAPAGVGVLALGGLVGTRRRRR